MTEQEAFTKIQKLCSQQEKCIQDVKLKLTSWKIEPGAADKIIKLLIEQKFIDETRYAKSFVNDKFRFNKWGKAKIAYNLRQKKIDKTLIDKTLETIDAEDYIATITELLQKKRKTIRDSDLLTIRHKLVKFAYSKGFDYEAILQAVQAVLNEENSGN